LRALHFLKRAARYRSSMHTKYIFSLVVLLMMGCSDGVDGSVGAAGPPGPEGKTGAPGTTGTPGHDVGMRWVDANGKIIPVVGESVQVAPQGPSVLYFVDDASTHAVVWGLVPADGAIRPASRVSPVFPSDDCSGTPYIYAVARWTYDVIGTKKVVFFDDAARPVKIMPQSTIDANGACVASASPPDDYFSVADGVTMQSTEIPSNRFALPIHAEFAR
jgi:hypothetical protein